MSGGVNVPRCPHDTIHAPSTTTRSAPPFRLYVSLAAVYAWIGPSINVTTLHGPLTLDSEGRVAITAGSASRATVTRSAVVRITAIHAGAGIGDAPLGRQTSVEEAIQFRADRLKMPVAASFQIPPKPALGVAQARRQRQ
jgi:hypothetical protein